MNNLGDPAAIRIGSNLTLYNLPVFYTLDTNGEKLVKVCGHVYPIVNNNY